MLEMNASTSKSLAQVNLVLTTALKMLAAVESRLHASTHAHHVSLQTLNQRQSTANETAHELVRSVERLNESLAGLTKQLVLANLTLTSDSAALKDAVLAQGMQQKQLNVSMLAYNISLDASMLAYNTSVSMLTSKLMTLNESTLAQHQSVSAQLVSFESSLNASHMPVLHAQHTVLHAQHTKAAKSLNERVTEIDVQLDKVKASVLALDTQSKMFDARMGAAVVQQQKQAEEQAQELKKKVMELAQEQTQLVLQAVQVSPVLLSRPAALLCTCPRLHPLLPPLLHLQTHPPPPPQAQSHH